MTRSKRTPLETDAGKKQLWRTVGAFLKKRREQLGLTQREVMQALGYGTPHQISNIERGAEGVQVKRAAAWADLLEVPRDSFLLFIVGQREVVGPSDAEHGLGAVERELLGIFGRLSRKYRERLVEQAREYETLTMMERRKRTR